MLQVLAFISQAIIIIIISHLSSALQNIPFMPFPVK